jgi:hypothetical protein
LIAKLTDHRFPFTAAFQLGGAMSGAVLFTMMGGWHNRLCYGFCQAGKLLEQVFCSLLVVFTCRPWLPQ